MERRKFLRCSMAAAIALPGIASFSGCSGGGGSTTPATSLSATDQQVVAISSVQALNDSTHNEISSTSTELLVGTSASAAPSLAGLIHSSSMAPSLTSRIFSAFTGRNLAISTATFTKVNAADSYFGLSSWEDKLTNHNLAYSQATAQITKLKASLRLYGYKQSTATQAAIEQSGALLAPAKSSASDVLLATFNKAITDFKNADFGAVALDGLSLAINAVLVLLEALKGTTSGYYYATLAFNAIEDILKWIQVKSLSNISFSTDTSIILSISKIAVAAISVLGIVGLENLKAPVNNASSPTRASALTADEQAELTAFLEGTKLQSQLILTLTSFVDGIMQNIVGSTQTRADELANAVDNTDGTYTLTADDEALVISLQQQALVLAALGLVMKVLVDFYNAGLGSTTDETQLDGDAQTYSALFGNPISAFDTIFAGFTSSNFTTLFSENTIISQLLADWQTLNPNIELTSTADALEATANTEEDAVGFASLMAQLSYQFSSDTTTQAYNFATNMSELAYQFTMKIEDDAYTFAMQGMEYGYLFASRGEEVGLMADRILWMAVQIGQMADRIGEMADRIVYTEQLIVYTEMLILDFGLLIYGGMKQIANLMLMGMAIVFDREWYTPSTGSDPVVDVISSMTTQMLSDMHVYQLAVLENQNTLRQTTLGALDWIQGEY
jgi:hypothetical protein